MNAPAKPLSLKIGKRAYPIQSFAQASAMVDEVRKTSGVGGSEFPRILVFEGSEAIGYVSYNGRVWKGDPMDTTNSNELLYDNRLVSR